MGGNKHKQANRTKNNVKPASSGRSAEILATKSPPTVGFSVLKPVMTTFNEDVRSEITQDFQLAFKKMNKKDATTKLKALQEFTTLCQKSEPSAVKTVLPFWPRLYCVLATDIEHRVREGAHSAQRAVVTSVGRNIAPYLKQLVGTWFVGQYDTYAPAASTASLSFNEAFPLNKLTEAITFCQDEIFDYIFNNLQTESISDEKLSNPEDSEAKYQRVIISSFHGYASFLSNLGSEQIQNSEEKHKKLVKPGKFWNYAKHENPLIRAAWFTAIISLCQKAPFLLSDEGKHLGAAVFGGLDENDPTVLPIVWEAALHILVAVQDIWQHVSSEKLVFPKLWRILKEGGQGNASMIFPNILPLLSKIPSFVIKNQQEFYTKLFDSMRTGFTVKSVKKSNSEMEAIIHTFMECVQYLVMINYENTDLCHSIINNQIIPLVETMMFDEMLQPTCSAYFCGLSKLIRLWTKQDGYIYQDLCSLFWKKVEELIITSINNSIYSSNLLATTFYAQYMLLLALKSPGIKRQKKYMKVKFTSFENEKEMEAPVKNFDNSVKTELSEAIDKYLDNLINVLLKLYLQLSFDKPNLQGLIVEQISKIIKEFNSELIYKQVLDSIEGLNCWQKLYTTKLVNWLLDDSIPVDYSLTIIFILLKYTTEEEKHRVLQDLTKHRTHETLNWAVNQKNNFSTVLEQWLSSEELVNVLISLANEVKEDDGSFNILSKCLKMDEDGKLKISERALTGILSTLCTTLELPNVQPFTIMCIAKLLKNSVFLESNYFYIIKKNSQVPDLVKSIFYSLIENNNNSLIESANVEYTPCLKETLMIGIKILSKSYGVESSSFTDIIVGQIEVLVNYFNKSIVNISQLQYVTSLFEEIIISAVDSHHNVTDMDDQIKNITFLLQFILDGLEKPCEEWCDSVSTLCLIGNYINGILDFPVDEAKAIDNVPFNIPEVEKYFTCSYFKLKLLHTYCQERTRSDQVLYLPSESLSKFSSFINQVLYLHSIGQCWQLYFNKTNQYFSLKVIILEVEELLNDIIDKMSPETLQIVASTILNKALNVGGIWLQIISIEVPKLKNMADALKIIIQEDTNTNTKMIPEIFSFMNNEQLLHHCKDITNKSDDFLFLPEVNACLKVFVDNINEDVCNLYDCWLDKVISWNFQNNSSCVNQKSNIRSLNSICATSNFLCLALKHYSSYMKHSHWDICMIRVATWAQGIHDSVIDAPIKNNISVSWLCVVAVTCRMIDCIITKVEKECDDKDEIAKTRLNEWNEVFVSSLHKNLIESWQVIAEQVDSGNILELLLIENLGNLIIKHVKYPYFVDTTLNLKDSLMHWIHKCCNLIKSPITSIQLTAYNVLIKLIPAIVTADSEDNSNRLLCLSLEETLIYTQTVVDTMISDLRFGDLCIVQEFTDSYTYARAYLLHWSIILALCAHSDSQLRSLYTAWLKEDYLPTFMKTVFCLMPESVLHDYGIASKRTHDLFSTSPEINNEVWDSNKLSHFSCWVYACALKCIPAAIRQWWTKSEHKVNTIVDRVTATFISPQLSAEEIKAVKKEEKKFENMTIQIRPTVREIVAVYAIEDCSMELTFQLNHNHPLGLVKVNSVRSLISTSHIKNWLLQLTIFLTHQNGTILDSLVLWKNNLDKRFEGVEECYICFYVLHYTNHQLPKMTCPMCKKKFHSQCLYKWFHTSNKSSCPICRSMFLD